MITINHKAASALLLKYTLGQYPYDMNSEWIPLEEVFNRLQQHGAIAKFYLKQSGLLDDKGQWNTDLVEYGLIKPFSVLEADSATGYAHRVKQTLVSDRGFAFLTEFFDDTIG